MHIKGNISIDIDQKSFLSIHFNDVIRVNIEDLSVFDLLETDNEEKTNFWNLFKNVRSFAKTLRQNNKTIVLSVHGKEAIILGKEAHPSLSKIVTKSDDIEFKNIIELSKLSFEILE